MFVDGFNSTDDDVTGIELVLSDLMDVVEPPCYRFRRRVSNHRMVQQPFDLAHCITSNALKNEL